MSQKVRQKKTGRIQWMLAAAIMLAGQIFFSAVAYAKSEEYLPEDCQQEEMLEEHLPENCQQEEGLGEYLPEDCQQEEGPGEYFPEDLTQEELLAEFLPEDSSQDAVNIAEIGSEWICSAQILLVSGTSYIAADGELYLAVDVSLESETLSKTELEEMQNTVRCQWEFMDPEANSLYEMKTDANGGRILFLVAKKGTPARQDEIRCRVYLKDKNGGESLAAEVFCTISVIEEFYTIYPMDFAEDLQPGEAESFYPQLVRFSTQEPGGALEDCYWTFEWEEALLELRDEQGNLLSPNGMKEVQVSDTEFLLVRKRAEACVLKLTAQRLVTDRSTGERQLQTAAVKEFRFEKIEESGERDPGSGEPKEFSVSYELNGGKNDSSNPVSYKSGGEAIVLAASTRKGYSFKGWYRDAQFSVPVTEIAAGSTGELTFYANWSPKRYSVIFDGNGAGKGSMEALTKIAYDTDFVLTANAFQRTGYKFIGWNTSADGTGKAFADGEQVRNLSATSGGKVTLYAQWKAKRYSVIFDGNGAGKGSMEALTKIAYDTDFVLTVNAYQRTGYKFAGWNTRADGSGKAFADGEQVRNLSATSGGTVTLYAQWTAKRYSVIFDGNGAGEGSMEALTKIAYDTDFALTANVFQRTGYEFTGWNTRADGSGKAYADGAQVRNLSATSGGKVTLYVQWVPTAVTR